MPRNRVEDRETVEATAPQVTEQVASVEGRSPEEMTPAEWEEEQIRAHEEEAARLRQEREERMERSRLKAEAAAARRARAEASARVMLDEADAVLADVRALLPGAETWWPRLGAAMQAHAERLREIEVVNPFELNAYQSAAVIDRHGVARLMTLLQMLAAP